MDRSEPRQPPAYQSLSSFICLASDLHCAMGCMESKQAREEKYIEKHHVPHDEVRLELPSRNRVTRST